MYMRAIYCSIYPINMNIGECLGKYHIARFLLNLDYLINDNALDP